MAGEKLKVGVIGVGFGAAVHVPSLQSHPEVEVVAICSGRMERAKEAAERLGVPAAFDSYKEMLETAGLDAVTIATPTNMHYPMSIAAIEAGVHVICEKPFALNATEALDMYQRAEQAGVVHCVAHEFRYTAPRARMKELVDEGYIGKLQVVNASLFLGGPRRLRPWNWNATRENGGGFLFGLGSHYIDALRCWFGEIGAVSGRVYAMQPQRVVPGTEEIRLTDADDSFAISMEFAEGGWGTMIATSAGSLSAGVRIEAHGTEGVLVSAQTGVNPSPEGKLYGARAGERELQELDIPERLHPHSDPKDDRITSFNLLVEDFVKAIKSRDQASPNFYDGLRCQRVLDGVLESNKTRAWTTIETDSSYPAGHRRAS